MIVLVTFHSVGDALHTRMLLADRGAVCTVVPVPRSVSSSCGYALEASGIAPSALAETMNRAGIEWDALYRPAGSGNEKRCEYEIVSGRETGEENSG